ncbi:Swc7p KNAG_0B06030 [Huiozyma naganishii CBS 8797]|uniref:Uncharacterized protein n=1 Tax=Huiozyma naganishii (strain ATCC MYA-139 / BCRC 22969 / CBS 8797 / KCTC 17520 / NBRC 10181 / NCYC 3082 / Yp74L-3) TaxID=1071383 RepID=J7RHL5_HUIN7|nr:hypothetical protein KNAG_0B06030 [Kazachstania naganishii CBS 8797]CCK69033.1 hypothetical protein KNAG_0B06030 [Kazachstania naganishii CBS 8797]
MSTFPHNVALLLLQILLQRQQYLAHRDKSLQLKSLLKEPIVDAQVLEQFTSHKLVKLYSPELQDVTLRTLRAMVGQLFVEGAEELSDQQITVITLANSYYNKRIQQLETQLLPQLKQELVQLLQ